MNWAKANPQIFGAIMGALGPTAGLVGNLASGGQGPTTLSGANQSGFNNQSGFSNSNTSGSQQTITSRDETGSRTDSGFNNQTIQPIIDPAAQGAMDRLSGMLGRNAQSAQGANDLGLSLLEKLATGSMDAFTSGSGASALQGPNTTPTPTAVGNFPTSPPTAYNSGLGNLIKQAFGSFVGDLGSQAITNARNRGFSGGGDLLNSAAAPMMGQTLAQVPAMEAKAYMDHVLQAYGLESENAGRVSAANAAAMNAGTNALGPGIAKYSADVSKYGIDRNADNQQLGQLTSLLQALMQPNRDLMTGNTNLLSAAPRGSTNNTLSGNQSNTSLSGTSIANQTNQSQSQGQTGSNTQSGSQSNAQTQATTPMGNVIGTGVGNILGGIGTGIAAGGGPDFTGDAARTATTQRTILDLLRGKK